MCRGSGRGADRSVSLHIEPNSERPTLFRERRCPHQFLGTRSNFPVVNTVTVERTRGARSCRGHGDRSDRRNAHVPRSSAFRYSAPLTRQRDWTARLGRTIVDRHRPDLMIVCAGIRMGRYTHHQQLQRTHLRSRRNSTCLVATMGTIEVVAESPTTKKRSATRTVGAHADQRSRVLRSRTTSDGSGKFGILLAMGVVVSPVEVDDPSG